MVRLLAERYDTKSNVKLGRFPSQLQRHWRVVIQWNSLSVDDTHIYIYIYIYNHTFQVILISIDRSDYFEESLSGIVANMLDCDIIVNKFKLQKHNYNHFQTNAPLE